MSLPIEAKKYSRQLLVEQGLLQFFVAIKARESKQLFLKARHSSVSDKYISLHCHNVLERSNLGQF